MGRLNYWIPPACTTLMSNLVVWNPVGVGLLLGLNQVGQLVWLLELLLRILLYLHEAPEFSVLSKIVLVVFQIIKTVPDFVF